MITLHIPGYGQSRTKIDGYPNSDATIKLTLRSSNRCLILTLIAVSNWTISLIFLLRI